jgi:hypothetical protein
MKPMSAFQRVVALVLTSLAFLAGCGGGGGDGSASTTTPTTGTLSVAITDSPACGYDHVFITVEKVRVHQSPTANDTDAGWQEILLNPPRRIDLLALTNGVLEELGQTALPAGTYTQMRLVLASNNVSSAPYPNAVVPTSASPKEELLTTPSGQQSGIKMNVDITVEPDKVADFVIDFDACKSVVTAGNSGKYLLKPVVTGYVVLSDAGQRIVGYIDPATMGENTKVSVQQGGAVAKATPPDATGKFVLYPVSPGTYDLVIVSAGKATTIMTGVPVVTTGYTFIGGDTTRIGLVDSPSNDVTGKVTRGVSTVDTDATVRALQTLHNGPTIEISSMPVDAATGEYGFTLPIGSPWVGEYLPANPLSLVFSPDSTDPNLTAAGKYALQASIPGKIDQTTNINLLAGPKVQDFTFPAP